MALRIGSSLALIGLLGALLLLLAIACLLLPALNWFPRRDGPMASASDLDWRQGKIVVEDFCTFPGSYDMEIWWVSPKGENVLLLDLGDNKHFDYHLAGDQFCVRYWSFVGNTREDDRWTQATFDSPDEKPTLSEVPDSTRRSFRFGQWGPQRSDLNTSK